MLASIKRLSIRDQPGEDNSLNTIPKVVDLSNRYISDATRMGLVSPSELRPPVLDTPSEVRRSVLGEIISQEASSWDKADDFGGNLRLRLGVLAETYAHTSQGHHVEDEAFAAALHSLLIVTSSPRDTRLDEKCAEYTEEDILTGLKNIVMDYCTGVYGEDEDLNSLDPMSRPRFNFCAWLVCMKRYNVPIEFLRYLSEVVRSLVSRSAPYYASYGIDVLFHFILERDDDCPYLYPRAPFDRTAQGRQLMVLVDILVEQLDSEASHPSWKALAHMWCALVKERCSDFRRIEANAEQATINHPPASRENRDGAEVITDTLAATDHGTEAGGPGEPNHGVRSFGLIPGRDPSSQPGGESDRHLEGLLRQLADLCSHHPPADGMNLFSRPAEFSDLDMELHESGSQAFSFVKWLDGSKNSYLKDLKAVPLVPPNSWPR